MPKVLIADKMSSQAAEVFRERGIEVEIATGLAPEELIARIGAYDGLAVRSATQVTEATIEAAGPSPITLPSLSNATVPDK